MIAGAVATSVAAHVAALLARAKAIEGAEACLLNLK
jgi:hypothetical protein